MNCGKDHGAMVRDMIRACFVYWSTDPEIQRTFVENAATKDGFIKIQLTGLEIGWKERRYS
jgi:hypothetical protein